MNKLLQLIIFPHQSSRCINAHNAFLISQILAEIIYSLDIKANTSAFWDCLTIEIVMSTCPFATCRCQSPAHARSAAKHAWISQLFDPKLCGTNNLSFFLSLSCLSGPSANYRASTFPTHFSLYLLLNKAVSSSEPVVQVSLWIASGGECFLFPEPCSRDENTHDDARKSCSRVQASRDVLPREWTALLLLSFHLAAADGIAGTTNFEQFGLH